MRRSLFVLLLLLAGSVRGAGLSPEDAASVRKVLQQYVAAWLAGEPSAVLQWLTEDSVLIPGANPAYVGRKAIQNNWWPPNAPAIAVTRFDTTVDELTGSEDLAVVRGTQILEFRSATERWRTKGNYVTILRRTADGWRISTQFPANVPNERID